MNCMVLIPRGEAPILDSPDCKVPAGLGGYLAVEADDLKSAIKLAARIRTAEALRRRVASRSGAGVIATGQAPGL